MSENFQRRLKENNRKVKIFMGLQMHCVEIKIKKLGSIFKINYL